jgi:DNA-binding GntR family transcriptional regulator
VYRVLKNKILDYRLRPAQRITEIQVAEDLRVSRTPAREALRRLGQEGWLTLVPHQGYYVRAFTTREVDEIYDLRVAVERHTARLAAESGNRGVLAQLSEQWARIAGDSQRTDPLMWLQADEEFHRTIAEATRNRELVRTLQRINERIRIIRRIDYSRAERTVLTAQEHLRILDRIQARDGAVAADRMEQHILESKTSVKALAQIYLMEEGEET